MFTSPFCPLPFMCRIFAMRAKARHAPNDVEEQREMPTNDSVLFSKKQRANKTQRNDSFPPYRRSTVLGSNRKKRDDQRETTHGREAPTKTRRKNEMTIVVCCLCIARIHSLHHRAFVFIKRALAPKQKRNVFNCIL